MFLTLRENVNSPQKVGTSSGPPLLTRRENANSPQKVETS